MESSSELLLKQNFAEVFLEYRMFFSVFAAIFLWLSFKWFTIPAQKKNLPPSPQGLPILGNLHQLSSLPHYPLRALAQKYGPVIILQFGSVPTLVVSSAPAASQVMKTHDIAFADRPLTSITKRLLYNKKDVSVAPYGEYWRQLKGICVVQLLSTKKVHAFRGVREEEIALAMESINESSLSSAPVNLSEMFTSLTNDIVCRSAFGRKYGGLDGQKFRQLLSELIELLAITNLGLFIPWLGWINRFNGFDARVDRVAKELDKFLDGVVQERLDHPAPISAVETNEEDFLDILLRIYKDEATNVSMDRDSIKAVILDVFSAGTDSTATVPEWTMTELFRHPIVMKKLQNEVREVLNGKQAITDQDLEEMHYLNAVVKETLRLHPPFPLLVPRKARVDVEVMGHHVAAGTMVMINAWAIGRDPASWDEPEKFKPERFLNSSIDYKGHDFQLIPFGAGRRGCPGTAFAMATNVLLLANIVHKFDWKLPNGRKGEDLDVDEFPGASIKRKNPLLAVATPFSF